MRFAIIGAGGIGAYYGARLQRGGHDVLFIARGAQLEALLSHGLRVRHTDFEFDAPVEAMSLEALCSGREPQQFDLLLLCVKSMATGAVADQLAGWLGDARLPVLSLQNGVDNEPELAHILGADRVLGGYAVRIGAHVTASGVIEAVGPGQVVLGEWPRAGSGSRAAALLPDLVEAFGACGIPTRVADDILKELWRKLIVNNGVNPLSALAGRDTGVITRDPLFAAIVRGMMGEAARAAAADGVVLTEADADEMFELISRFDPIKTSMQVDREHGRAIELEEICGAVLARSRRLGIEAPYTHTVYALLKHGLRPPL